MTEDEIRKIREALLLGQGWLDAMLEGEGSGAYEENGRVERAEIDEAIALCDTALSRRAEPVGWLLAWTDGSSSFAFTEEEADETVEAAADPAAVKRPVFYASPSPATGARVKPLPYERVIAIVADCVERMKKTGESHNMLAKWISEGINAALTSSGNADPAVEIDAAMRVEALRLLGVEDERQDKLHDLLETIREQIRTEITPEQRPTSLMTNIQNAVYAMRGRTRLLDDAALTAALKGAQP